MRESIGSTWTLQLIILFILLFVGFLTLSLGYSKAYKVKNETMSIIEKYEGATEEAVLIINNYMQYNKYTAKGKCPDNTWYGLDNLSVYTLEKADSNKNYYYCLKKINTKNNHFYYKLNTFYKFNLPIVGDFVTFTLEGSTSDILVIDDPSVSRENRDNYTAY